LIILVIATLFAQYGASDFPFSAKMANRIVNIGPGFYNIRASFDIDSIDIGTHMSLIQLQSGKVLVVDTVALDPELKTEIDIFTKNGTLMAAIIATHPFHTTYFPDFYKAYPNVTFYGTPRHLRIQPQIPWKGSMYDCNVRQMWNPEVRMRIPAGAEFVAPVPESSNHFTAIHVFHPASKTIHVDDTIIYDLPFDGDMTFHPSLAGPALYHVPQAPFAFRDWVQNYINQWDFDIICAAHKGIKMGGAKAQVVTLLEESAIVFNALTEEFTLFPVDADAIAFSVMNEHEANCKE